MITKATCVCGVVHPFNPYADDPTLCWECRTARTLPAYRHTEADMDLMTACVKAGYGPPMKPIDELIAWGQRVREQVKEGAQ